LPWGLNKKDQNLSDDKKDLTRIEELGEFIHELSEENSFEESPPDLPVDEINFDSPEEENSEDNQNESSDTFTTDNNDFSSSDSFTSSEEVSFTGTDTAEEINFTSESTFEDSSPFSDKQEENSSITENQFNDENDLFKENVESNVVAEDKQNDDEFSTYAKDQIEEEEEEKKGQEELVVTPPIKNDETPLQVKAENTSTSFSTPEDFSEVKKFAENSHYSGMAAEGNPSFSVLISQIKFIEDIEDILRLLKELNLLGDDIEQARKRLLRGSFLVPRISEYAAILLAHKLRRFDIDLQLGLSDDIHPPKHGEKPETGIVSKTNLYQNQNHHFQFHHPKVELSQILISTTSNLEGYQIHRYLGIATENQLIDGHQIEEEKSQDIPKAYQDIAHKLKAQALQVNANAIVGITYQLTPLPVDLNHSSTKYRLSCSGNLVWVNKL